MGPCIFPPFKNTIIKQKENKALGALRAPSALFSFCLTFGTLGNGNSRILIPHSLKVRKLNF